MAGTARAVPVFEPDPKIFFKKWKKADQFAYTSRLGRTGITLSQQLQLLW